MYYKLFTKKIVIYKKWLLTEINSLVWLFYEPFAYEEWVIENVNTAIYTWLINIISAKETSQILNHWLHML